MSKNTIAFERLLFRVCAIAVVTGHVLLVFYFLPPHLVLDPEPLSGGRFDLTATQVSSAARALDACGRTWAYEPAWFGGYPGGTALAPEVRGWALWTFALHRLGLPQGLAFNLFVLVAHLLVLPAVYLAARLFRFAPAASLTAAALGSSVWFFDGFVHWSWWSGMVPFASLGYFCFVPLGIITRTIDDKKRWQIALACVLALFAMVGHPKGWLVLGAPLGALYLKNFKTAGRKGHLWALSFVLCAVLANAEVLRLAFFSDHQQLVLGRPAGGTLVTLLTDFLGLTRDRSVTGGVGLRSGFRFLALAVAGVTLIYHRNMWDIRLWVLGSAMLSMLALAYLSGHAGGEEIGLSYELVIPASFAAVLLTAHFASAVIKKQIIVTLSKPALTLLAVLSLVAAPRLVRDVLYFVPPLLPVPEELPEEKPYLTDTIGFGGIGFPRQWETKHTPRPPIFEEVAQRLLQEKRPARVVVESASLATYLMRFQKIEVLGGPGLLSSTSAKTDPFGFSSTSPPAPMEMVRAMARRGATGIVAIGKKPLLDKAGDSVELAWQVKPFAFYRAKSSTGVFEKGAGRIETGQNRITVSKTDPNAEIILRYGWLNTLKCRPKCKAEPAPVKGNGPAFICIPQPHPDQFTIYNGY